MSVYSSREFSQLKRNNNHRGTSLLSMNNTYQSDVQYKMCKKIAQLTKVIYYLNSKDEDQQEQIRSLKQLYEEEIENIINFGNSQIKKLSIEHEKFNIQKGAFESTLKVYTEKLQSIENLLNQESEKTETLIKEKELNEKKYNEQKEKLRLKIRNLESENNKLKTRSNSYINVINQQSLKYRTLQEENLKKLEEVKNNYTQEISLAKTKNEKEISQLKNELADQERKMKVTIDEILRQYQIEADKNKEESDLLLEKARRKSQELTEAVSSLEELNKIEKEGHQQLINQKNDEIRQIKESQYSNDRALLQLLKKIEVEENKSGMENIEEEMEEKEKEDNNNNDNNNDNDGDDEYEEIIGEDGVKGRVKKSNKSTNSINLKDGEEFGKKADINDIKEEGLSRKKNMSKLISIASLTDDEFLDLIKNREDEYNNIVGPNKREIFLEFSRKFEVLLEQNRKYKIQIEKNKDLIDQAITDEKLKSGMQTDQLIEENSQMKLDLNKAKGELTNLQEKMEFYKNIVEKFKKENEVLRQNEDSLNNKINIQKEQMDEASRKLNEKLEDCKMYSGRIEDVVKENKKLTEDLKSTQTKLEQMTNDLHRHAAELKSTNAKLTNREGKLKLAEEQNNNYRIKTESLTKEVTTLKKNMETLKSDYENKMTENEKRVTDDLRKKFDLEKANCVNELTTKFKGQLDKKDEELKDLEDQILKEKEDHERDVENAKEESKEELKALKNKVKNLNNQVETLEENRLSKDTLIVEKNNEIEGLNSQIKLFEARVEGLMKEQEKLKNDHLKEDDELREELRRKFEYEKANLKVEWEINNKKEIANLKIELQKKLDDDIKANEEKLLRKQTIIIKQVKDGCERDKGKLEKKCEEYLKRIEEYQYTCEEYDNEIKNLKEAHKKALNEIHIQHDIEIRKLKIQSEESINKKRKEMDLIKSKAIEKLDKKYKIEISKLNKKYKNEMDELRYIHKVSLTTAVNEINTNKNNEIEAINIKNEAEMKKMASKHSDEIQKTRLNITEKYTNEINKNREIYESDLKSKNDQIEVLQNMVLKESTDKENYLKQIQELNAIVEENKKNISKLKETFTLSQKESAENLIKMQLELEAKNQLKINELNEEHLKESKQMLREFDEAQNFLKKQIAMHKKEIQEAEIRYINREPREVDIQKIKELEQFIQKKQESIDSLYDEIEYYRLELTNREKNFNKLFNNHPIVGVIQPLKGQKSIHLNSKTNSSISLAKSSLSKTNSTMNFNNNNNSNSNSDSNHSNSNNNSNNSNNNNVRSLNTTKPTISITTAATNSISSIPKNSKASSTTSIKNYSKTNSNLALNNALGTISKSLNDPFYNTRINNTPAILGQPAKLPPLQRIHNTKSNTN